MGNGFFLKSPLLFFSLRAALEMIARLGCLSLSHHHAPVVVREALCLAPEARDGLHRRAAGLKGFALLSTCNRLEFYIERESGDARSLQDVVAKLLPKGHIKYLAAAEPYVHEFAGLEAARHLARVASGLDSMVLGEAQIQGQVQECFRRSEAYKLASPLLSAVFQAALRAGGRVRQETALGRSPVSVASVAVGLAGRLAAPLADQRIAIIGAGAMGRLVAKILRGAGVTRLILVNRTEAHAEEVAEAVGAQVRPLHALESVLHESDVVFSTARGQGIFLGARHIGDREACLTIIDLAVPRNVDTSVRCVPHVRLFDIDSLRDCVDASLDLRRAEVPKATAIIDAVVGALARRAETLAVEPVIRELRRKAEEIRQTELKRALDNMSALDAESKDQLRYFSQTLVNKLLHEPTRRLRERAATSGVKADADLIRMLFAL